MTFYMLEHHVKDHHHHMNIGFSSNLQLQRMYNCHSRTCTIQLLFYILLKSILLKSKAVTLIMVRMTHHHSNSLWIDQTNNNKKKSRHSIHHTHCDLLWNFQEIWLFRSYLQTIDTGTFIRNMKMTPKGNGYCIQV